MAKSAYTKQRELLMSYARTQKYKKGIEIELPNIPTERELRKLGISGPELTKQTNRLKHIRKHQKQLPAHERGNEGNRATVEELQRERITASRSSVSPPSDEVVDTNFSAYMNMYEYLINSLNQPVASVKYRPSRGVWERRDAQAIEASTNWRDSVLREIDKFVAENGGGDEGKAKLGGLFMGMSQHDLDFITDDLLRYGFEESIEKDGNQLMDIIHNITGIKFDSQAQALADEEAEANYNEYVLNMILEEGE